MASSPHFSTPWSGGVSINNKLPEDKVAKDRNDLLSQNARDPSPVFLPVPHEVASEGNQVDVSKIRSLGGVAWQE